MTHLDTDPANTPSQVAAVAAYTGRYADGAAVIVGGDFNATPDRPAMEAMAARFVEADAGEDAFTGGCSAAHCGAPPGTHTPPTRSTTCSCPAVTSPTSRR